MKEFLAAIGTVLTIVAIIAAATFGANYFGLVNYKFFGPQYEGARRQVFEETKSYRDGTRRDFDNLHLQYLAADSDEQKAAILATIRHRASGVPPELVPQEIKDLLVIRNTYSTMPPVGDQ